MPRIILGMDSANERRRYNVTLSLIVLVETVPRMIPAYAANLNAASANLCEG